MADKTQATLAQFYRDFVQPDTERVLREISDVRKDVVAWRRDNDRHFDAFYKRLDTIQEEIQSLNAAVKRLEADVAALKRGNVRQELDQIKARIAKLEEQVSEIESQL
jgi:peptidoglycan hydrolase CwlO-like protein